MTTMRRRVSGALRIRVMERDGYRCVYCGTTSQEARLQVDHIVPVARGGSSESTNLVTACFDCNNGKSAHAIALPAYITATPVVVEPVWARPTRVPPMQRPRTHARSWTTEARRRYPDAADMAWMQGTGRFASVAWCAGLTVLLCDRDTGPFPPICGHGCWFDHEMVDLGKPQILHEAAERERQARRVAHFERCRTCEMVYGDRVVGDAIERASLRLIQAGRAPETQATRWRTLAVVPEWAG